jgi:hypothetical protein
MIGSLNPGMLQSIRHAVSKIRTTDQVLDVYPVAEQIRLQHLEDNVAREDIINALVTEAGSYTAMIFAPSADSEDRLPSSFAPSSSEEDGGSEQLKPVVQI